MKKMNLVLAWIVALSATSAFAGVGVSVVGTGNYGLTNTALSGAGYTGTVKGGLGYGAGLLFGFPMGGTTEFDLGGIYSVSTLTTSSTILGVAQPDSTSTNYAIHIPGTLQFKMGHAVSLGLGGFYDVGVGNSSGSSDYGAVGGLRFHLSPKMFFDAAYNLGLKDQSGVKSSMVFAMIGLNLGK